MKLDPPKGHWWNEVGLGPFLEKRLGLTPQRIDDTVEMSREMGKSIAMSWPNLREQVDGVLEHPQVPGWVTPGVMGTTATLGYTVAGIEAVAGAAKLIQGVRVRDKTQILGGMLDLTAGGAIAATLLGANPTALWLGPVAAGLGVARGAVHAVQGYKEADSAKEVQGFMDATRSAAVAATVAGYSYPALSVAASFFAPLAVFVQACRGHVRLSQGIKNEDRGQLVNGLTDLGTALGLTLTFSGLGLPGLVLTVGSMSASLLHQTVPPFARAANAAMDHFKEPATKWVTAVDSVVDPVIAKIRHWVNELTPWQHGEDKPPPPPPPV
jgi:hypothetical protein